MILSGSRLFLMVFGCSFVVLCGSCWFLMVVLVLSDSWQFLVVFGGLLAVLSGSCWVLFFCWFYGFIGDYWRFLVVIGGSS